MSLHVLCYFVTVYLHFSATTCFLKYFIAFFHCDKVIFAAFAWRKDVAYWKTGHQQSGATLRINKRFLINIFRNKIV